MKSILQYVQMLYVLMISSIIGKAYSKTFLDQYPIAEAIRLMAATSVHEMQMQQNDLLSMVGINRGEIDIEEPSYWETPKLHTRKVDDTNLGTPEVMLKDGYMFGRTTEQTHIFFSIPYAKAPLGTKR